MRRHRRQAPDPPCTARGMHTVRHSVRVCAVPSTPRPITTQSEAIPGLCRRWRRRGRARGRLTRECACASDGSIHGAGDWPAMTRASDRHVTYRPASKERRLAAGRPTQDRERWLTSIGETTRPPDGHIRPDRSDDMQRGSDKHSARLEWSVPSPALRSFRRQANGALLHRGGAPRHVRPGATCAWRTCRSSWAVAWRLPDRQRATSENRVRCSRNARRILPVGPLRCLATMISATPFSELSGLYVSSR